MSTDSLTLHAGDVDVVVVPAAGGRVAQITVAGTDLLVDGLPDREATSTGWGCYPMVPWAGRIRNGRFRFAGAAIELGTNHVDASPSGSARVDPRRSHAIHGIGFQRRWTVDGRERSAQLDTVRMSVPLDGTLGWPFGGAAAQTLTLGPTSLDCRLTVSADDRSLPAEIGWHPWFRKPDELDFSPTAMYLRDDVGVTTPTLVDVPPGPWDDCFLSSEPVHLRYRRSEVPVVTVESDCDHLVVYDEPAHATCVEPQSGPPDAVNIRPRTLMPGESLTRTMTIGWERPFFTVR